MSAGRGPFADLSLVPEWRLATDVGCAQPGVDPELFFTDMPSAQARVVCAMCPYQAPCREWGLRNERHGMWGGLVEEERRRVRQLRGIATPLWDGPDWERLDDEVVTEEWAA